MQEIDKLAWIYIQDKQLLSARSQGKTAYYLPGGKREVGENDEAALCREIKEELAIDLIPTTIRYLETFRAQADGKPVGTMVKLTCYTAAFQGVITASSEIAEMIWITSQDRAHCSPAALLLLDWLKAKELIA